MTPKQIFKLLEDFSTEYKSDRTTVGTHQRSFLFRRWEVCKILIEGLNDKNYKKSLKLLGRLMDIDPEPKSMDGKLLKKLVDALVLYEKEKGW